MLSEEEIINSLKYITKFDMKKLDLINSKNPEWKDLYDEIVENYSNLNFPF